MRGGEAIQVAVLRFARVAIVAIPLAITTSVTFAQPRAPEVVDANVPPTRPPSVHFPFAESPDGVSNFAFAPDGMHGYAQQRVELFNFWEMAVRHWPELGAGVLLLLSLATAAVVRRRLRWRENTGTRHCRKCGYELPGRVQPAICPECGADLALHPPRPGRSVLRRLAPVVAPGAAMALTYTTLLTVGVPRYGRVSRWVDMGSVTAARALRSCGVLTSQLYLGSVTHALAWDDTPRSRPLRATMSLPASFLLCSPDGRTLVADQYGEVFVLDARTGGMLDKHSFFPMVTPQSGPDYSGVTLGFTTDRPGALIQTQRRILRLDFETRQLSDVMKLPSIRALVCGPAHPPGVLSIADQEVERTPLPGVTRVVQGLSMDWLHRTVLGDCTPDERFLVSPDSPGLRIRDAQSRTSISLVAGPNDTFASWFDVSPVGNLLAVATRRPAILVRDLERNAWVAALALPPGFYAAEPIFSPDGRWIAARAQTGDGRATPIRHELLLWDLSQILATSEHAQPAPPANP
jgi:hypothetical protein